MRHASLFSWNILIQKGKPYKYLSFGTEFKLDHYTTVVGEMVERVAKITTPGSLPRKWPTWWVFPCNILLPQCRASKWLSFRTWFKVDHYLSSREMAKKGAKIHIFRHCIILTTSFPLIWYNIYMSKCRSHRDRFIDKRWRKSWKIMFQQ